MLIWIQTALAGPTVSAEALTTVAAYRETADTLGSGVGARLGFPLRAGGLQLVPEVGVTGWRCDETMLVPEAGARLTLGRRLRPGVFGHLGYLLASEPRPGFDVGGSFDVVLGRFEAGLQLGWQYYGDLTAVGGLQVSFRLGSDVSRSAP